MTAPITRLLPLAAALLASAAPAEPSQAELLVRQEKPAEALRLLSQAQPDMTQAEINFWKARALVQLGQLREALPLFQSIPAEHELYPYAARGILYCAWHDTQSSFTDAVEPLLASPDRAVAELALAAIAEDSLRYKPEQKDTGIYEKLYELSQQNPKFQPIAKLLKVDVLRKKGEYDEGIAYARTLEQDATLTPLMKQRVRLALAELYYDKEKEPLTPRADQESEQTDEGKGEETLLQFITANPDSPLLAEAFRRLYRHGALANSEYALSKLQEWAEDTLQPKRAALAIFSLQQHDEAREVDSAPLTNKASSELPGEARSVIILQEHLRRLLENEKHEEAELYLTLLNALPTKEAPSVRSVFLQAGSSKKSPREALEMFRYCVENADSEMLAPAQANMLISAMKAGDTATAGALLSASDTPPHVRLALLLAHASMILTDDPQRAQQELKEALTLSPDPVQKADAQLKLIQLEKDPQQAINTLLAMHWKERELWTTEQELHYAGLVEKAADMLSDTQPENPSAESLLQRLYEESSTLPRKEHLALHLAERFSRRNQHTQALELLLDLAQQQPTGERKAATLLYAGQEAARQGSLPALLHAIELYAEAARQGSGLTTQAILGQATLLVRINRSAEAMELLTPLRHPSATLTPHEKAYLLSVLANAMWLEGTPESSKAAIDTCAEIRHIPNLPQIWRTRALLQHAGLCTRMHKHEQALADYLQALRTEQSTADAGDAHSCFLLYYAGAGAVHQLLQLERYGEAAALAEKLAAWPGTPEEPAATPSAKSAEFARWAQDIRQMNYLPSAGNP